MNSLESCSFVLAKQSPERKTDESKSFFLLASAKDDFFTAVEDVPVLAQPEKTKHTSFTNHSHTSENQSIYV
jgi:hypothetical protein